MTKEKLHLSCTEQSSTGTNLHYAQIHNSLTFLTHILDSYFHL